MKKRLRIVSVMIIPPIPNKNAAGHLSAVLLKGLISRGHFVKALVVCRDESEIDEVKAIFPEPTYHCEYFLPPERKTLSKIRSFMRPHSYFIGPKLESALREEDRKGFDILYLQHQWSAWAGLKYQKKAILDIHYLFHLDFPPLRPSMDAMNWIRESRTLQAEKHLIRRFAQFTTLTERVSKTIKQVNPSASINEIPFGMDILQYPYYDDQEQEGIDPVVGLIGSFDWYPSYSAGLRLLTKFWPKLKATLPGLKLCIVGRNADRAFHKFSHLRDVQIQGAVPDTAPFFKKLSVMTYAPETGSGIKVKVLEAFAYGTPVVTNHLGVEGLPAVDEIHAGISEKDEQIIRRTLNLLNSKALRRSYRQAARKLFESFCDPSHSVDKVESIFYANLASEFIA